jgi:hypothetical protein
MLCLYTYIYCLSWLVTSLITFFLYFETQGLAYADLVHGKKEISLQEKFPFFFLEPPLRKRSPDSEGLDQVSER